MTQSKGVSFDNDAKACYDQIIINLAMLASQKLGMPSHICHWFQQFLHQAQYHIQLPTLTSETYYT